VKKIADRYIHASYHNKYWRLATSFLDLLTSMTLNDLEHSKRGFSVILSLLLAAAHILRVNCDEMAGNKPRQPAYEIFSLG